jgi:hypothetical protein
VCQFGCNPVRDDLFLVDQSIAQAGTSASAAVAGSEGDPVTEVPEMPTAGMSAPEDVETGQRPALNSSVTFAWTESIPGAGACRAAMFTGRFDCMVATLLGRPDKVTGLINLVLHGSSEAQSLNIDGGQISAWDEAMNRIVLATVSGGLDCGSQRLDATIDSTPSDPWPIERQLNWANLNPQLVARGMLVGSLDPDIQEIAGNLELVFDPGGTRCVGMFSAKAWAVE